MPRDAATAHPATETQHTTSRNTTQHLRSYQEGDEEEGGWSNWVISKVPNPNPIPIPNPNPNPNPTGRPQNHPALLNKNLPPVPEILHPTPKVQTWNIKGQWGPHEDERDAFASERLIAEDDQESNLRPEVLPGVAHKRNRINSWAQVGG